MKRKLNRLLALLLCTLMMSSDLMPLIASAQPVLDAPSAVEDSLALQDAALGTGGTALNFNAEDNGRPNLFVHFLGDNFTYRYDAAGVNSGVGLNMLPVPAGFDQSALTNPDSTDPAATADDKPGNTWKRYQNNTVNIPGVDSGLIFWVGLGVDRREVLELLAGNKGLTSLEAGFYYDSRYVEPYVDSSGSFKTTIERANIMGQSPASYPANTQWSSDYEILRAEMNMPTATDPVTAEEMRTPSVYEIMGDTNWKMTYVSLELKQDKHSAPRRLAGAYKGIDGLPTNTVDGEVYTITPDAATGTGMQKAAGVQKDSDYQYLLLIPFKLRRYGDPERLTIRLIRDATHFSIGGGEEGIDPYAAWERTTVRNPGKDIKLQTRFNGDLQLFGNNDINGEVEYIARLYIDNNPTALNTAELAVNGDPAVWPVKATRDQEAITGLRSGLGMKVTTNIQPGYTVSVTVKYKDKGVEIIHEYQIVVPNKEYTFVIPEFGGDASGTREVEVHISFGIGDPEYHVFLSELFRTSLGAADTSPRKVGNETTITTTLDASAKPTSDSSVINSFDPPYAPHPAHPVSSGLHAHGDGPMGLAETGKKFKIDVSTHADYMAVVRISNYITGDFIVSDLKITTAKNDAKVDANTASANYGNITLPYGGVIELTMPAADLDVEVVYQPAPRYKATLEVYHKTGVAVTPMNTAQMAYLIYDDMNVGTTTYSGVVYHLRKDTVTPVVENHRELKTGADNKKLPWVPATQASRSKSLAGDTSRSGATWNPNTVSLDPVLGLHTVMTQLRSASNRTDFGGTLGAIDLNTQPVGPGWTGLRKDFQGQSFGEGDMSDLKDLLWEMRTRILNDSALKTAYDKSVTKTENGTTSTVYNYLDLTPAQVQAYILDILEAEEIQRTNIQQYKAAYQAYQLVKVIYDQENAKEALTGKLKNLDIPLEPADMTVDTNGVRTYQDAGYQNDAAGRYLYDYLKYLDSYRAYIEYVAEHGDLTAGPQPTTAPGSKAVAKIPIRPHDDGSATDAESKIAGTTFRANPVSTSATIETREDRTVWVALEGDSAYYVEAVELWDVDASNNSVNRITTITPTQSADYANLWSFSMPKRNCAVRVIYARRDTRNLYLQIIGADGEAKNRVDLEAYRYADHDATHYPTETPAVAPVLDTRTNAGNEDKDPYPEAPAKAGDFDYRYIYNVFEESTVILQVNKAKNYSVKVEVENKALGTPVSYIPATAPNPDDGDIYTFVIPHTTLTSDDVTVTVTYTKQRPQNTAYIRRYFVPGSPQDVNNEAMWHLEDAGGTVTYTDVIHNVYEGTNLLGDITVQPGYYIYGVVVHGASGNYPYILSGNGYNGGYGTMVSGTNVPVNIWVDMPAEDLYVDVYIIKGLPDPEPPQTLSLTVKDDDNEDKTTDHTGAAKNWAEARVYNAKGDATPITTIGKVGKLKDYGDGNLYDWDYVNTGKWVEVEFNADTGYYVSKVTVGPSNLGVALNWENDHTVSFYMPAGSAGIYVEFAKGEAPTYYLNVRETWFDMTTNSAVTGAEQQNFATYVDSYTISGDGPSATNKGWNGGEPVKLLWETNPERVPAVTSGSYRGVAKPGEEVTLTYIVDENGPDQWYVQSIILFSDGAATRLTGGTQLVANAATTPATCKTYEIKFRMPTGDASVTIHYRKGPQPADPDYAFTMVLYDNDNPAAKRDDNRLKATFADAVGGTGVHPDMELGLALATPLNTDVRHLHAGDVITLETKVQKGYTVDYVIVNPSSLSLYPSWQSTVTDASGVTKSIAKLTMPAQGIAVVARYIKGTPQKYTANLILRPPAGYAIKDVGKGTFGTPTGGVLTDYPTKAIYSTSQVPGTPINYDLYAADGFYIEKVTIEPAVGSSGSLSGSYGYQSGGFVMPAANVNVNVWFKKGWPDEGRYGLTLEVHDMAQKSDNWAKFRSTGSTDFTGDTGAGGNGEPVRNGQRKTIWGVAMDKDVVVVDVNTAAGYYYTNDSILVTDSQGNVLEWWAVPGGIAFTMPPRSTTVSITFKSRPATMDTYKATLVVSGAKTGDADPAKNDEARLFTAVANASPASVGIGGGTITGLYAHDVLSLTTRPGTDRHIASVYAVYTIGSDTWSVPIYADGALAAPPQLAGFIPGDPASAVTGSFTMPEADVTIYVRYANEKVLASDQWVTLWVSGPSNAGSASAEIKADVGKKEMKVYTPGATIPATDPSYTTTGMDTRITHQGSGVIVTFEPVDYAPLGSTYDIVKLEVYDKYGRSVPYEWISVIQDPEVLSDTNMWPDPPTDPTPIITHPTWKPNPKRQIKLTVPTDSVTVHVTYGAVKDKVYTAQIVVNDPYPATPTDPSSNDGWFGLLDAATRTRIRTAKPGEWIDLSVDVHPGYKIEYIKVLPQSYGISPTLPYGNIYKQNTGFYMPNGDCTVYIKFVRDTTELKTATLTVVGAPVGNSANYATIHSPISKTSKPAVVNGISREVTARPTVDWITVDYYWAASSNIASITVKTADGVDVPYTQNEDPGARHGRLVLPMPGKDITVTITYKDDPKPVGQEVVLHVIDRDRDAAKPILRDAGGAMAVNYGRLRAVYAVGADTYQVGPDTYPLAADPFESTYTIQVPAGERVNFTACSDVLGLDGNGKVYINAAYVLYEAGGQMLNMNLQPDGPNLGFSGPKDSYFIVHQGRNDVYLYLSRSLPRPQNEYSAVLMLKGPTDDSGQAGICVGESYDTAPLSRKAGLTQANHGHASVTATNGEKITINVVPSEGYAIDYIQVTPLGYPLSYTYLTSESTISFDMPHCNIAITVYLKKAKKEQYTLTLHYLQGDSAVSVNDYAKVSWYDEDGSQKTMWAWEGSPLTPPGASKVWGNTSHDKVRADEQVTLWVTLDNPDLILAAYTLSNGDLVPMTPTFPAGLGLGDGLEGVGETASAGDNTKADALATFTMPAADTDVYVVTTTTPPHPSWHTIILTASDYSPAGDDKGYSSGSIKQDDWADADAKHVKSFGVNDLSQSHTFLSLPEYKADGVTPNYYTVVAEPSDNPYYELNVGKTRLTKNTPPTVQSLSPTSVSSAKPPVVTYVEPVGNCNRVVHLVFGNDEDLTLTVEIEDPDNPGNGKVTNAVTAASTGVDTLNLYSHSIAGAYQIMSGLTAGAPVNLTVTPAPGYYAYAKLYQNEEVEATEIPLTLKADGTLTGSFPMPTFTSRVVVTFYIPYTGTLVLRDNTATPTTKAQMTESTGTAPDTVSVNAILTQTASLTHLPRGTELKANMVEYSRTDDKITGLLTVDAGTTFLTPTPKDGVDYFTHTIDRSDATITLIVDDDDAHGGDYIAAVRVVGRPDSLTDAAMPTITDTTNTAQIAGSIWTTAAKDHAIKLTVNVPAGYEARITTDAALALDGGANTTKTVATTTTANATTFTMPAQNVQVTVTYVRTYYRLTLHISDSSGVSGNATSLKVDSSAPANFLHTTDPYELTADAQVTWVKAGVDLTHLKATPVLTVPGSAGPPVVAPVYGSQIKRIVYQVEGSAPVSVDLTQAVGGSTAALMGYNSTTLSGFLAKMPAANMDVTVVYGSDKPAPTPPTADPDDYYLAYTAKAGAASVPGNDIVSIQNTSRTAMLNGDPVYIASPSWVAGYQGDSVKISFTTAPGYYAVVTAATRQTSAVGLPVVQIGTSGVGTASVSFPSDVGTDIVITVTYQTTDPSAKGKDVALQLVDHKMQKDNKAKVTDFTAPKGLVGLSIAGDATTHAPGYTNGKTSNDPVEIIKTGSDTGNDLRTLANWASGYQVVRMTVAIRTPHTLDSGCDETAEVDLPVSRYGGQATSRCPVPVLTGNQLAVIRVYYGNIYTATLHVVGADVPYDVTKATDERPIPVSSTGTVPITKTGDKLMDFVGGEQVQTTAIPDSAKLSGKEKRLVGVVWESDLTGAGGTTSTVPDRYDFNMPLDNVDFYAVYEEEPEDPADRSYIAKIAFAPDSVHGDSAGNKVTIKNASNTKAAGGNYWTAAKADDSITVNVKVATGYQAQIITTKIDDQSKLGLLPPVTDAVTGLPRPVATTDDYQYYITRTIFIPGTAAGKDAVFTMPAQTDATVTIRFTKGYDLTLELDDQTTGGTDAEENKAVAQVTGGALGTSMYGSITAVSVIDSTAPGDRKPPAATNSVQVGSGPHEATLKLDGAVNIPGNQVKIYPSTAHEFYVSGNESAIKGMNNDQKLVIYVEVAPGCLADISIYEGPDETTAKTNLVGKVVNSTGGEQSITMPTTGTDDLWVEVKFKDGSTAWPFSAASYSVSEGDTIFDLPGNLNVTTDVDLAPSLTGLTDPVVTQVFRTTPFTGTQNIPAGLSGKYPFTMPYEDTLETVVLKNDDATVTDKWYAKVELRGESDVTGNTATPVIDKTDPAGTTTGTVWTSTDDNGHTIDLTLTVAKGYVAKIKVVRDDSRVDALGAPTPESDWVFLDAWEYDFTWSTTTDKITYNDEKMVSAPVAPATKADIEEVNVLFGEGYKDPSPFPDMISGQQHFQFTMVQSKAAVGTPGDAGYEPAVPMTDVTIIVTFEKSNEIPRPFDPANKKMDKIKLDRGFIYAENRGDYAVVRIPTLADVLEDADGAVTGATLYDTDNYDAMKATPPKIHDPGKSAAKRVTQFVFAIYDAATDTYHDLEEGKEIDLLPYDEETLVDKKAPDPYNYILGMYHGTQKMDDPDTTAAKRDYVGSMLNIQPMEPDDKGKWATTQAKQLYEILNNKGSLESYTVETEPAKDLDNDGVFEVPAKTETRWRTILYVKALDANSGVSLYTPVWIRPWFALGVNVISYAPTHELTGELYRFMEEEELNIKTGYYLTNADGSLKVDASKNPVTNADPSKGATALTTPDPEELTHYKWDDDDQPEFTDVIFTKTGSGKWLQFLRVRSSELLGGYTTAYDPTEDATHSLLDNVDAAENLTYALQIKKASNLTYTRLLLDLNHKKASNTELYGNLATYYDAATRTFTITDLVYLLAGDVDNNGRTKLQDYDAVYDFVYRNRPWSKMKEAPKEPTTASTTLWNAYLADKAQWDISVYNPKSLAYRCDLDGNRKLTVADLDIVNTRFNYNRTEADYLWTKAGVSRLPYGLGADKSSYAALFAMGAPVEGELLADAYWDGVVEPETESSISLSAFWEGDMTPPPEEPDGSELTERPETAPDNAPVSAETHGERAETPMGEEAFGPSADLPVLGEAMTPAAADSATEAISAPAQPAPEAAPAPAEAMPAD